MKKLDAKFYLKLSCSAVLLGLFLFLINMPLHRVDSKDYDLLHKSYWYYSSQDEIGEKYCILTFGLRRKNSGFDNQKLQVLLDTNFVVRHCLIYKLHIMAWYLKVFPKFYSSNLHEHL